MTRHFAIAVAAVSALGLAGCATTPDGGAAEGLAGTSWKLVSFQSMDDAQGATKPAAGKDYTLAFGTDGRAAMQLDCNRGSANYSVGNTSATGGSLTFGPAAVTRALCPPPDMGEMLAARLSDVASYTMRDGHLFLALKLDGGIFEFSPN
ncbi:META domain-containing protein [Altererythrobacter salegens]|uniref:META domain-containing protein n=1 Tax=Croceibacterium salegens TaxID=1737568 RepID=A0A6I4SUI3_9SPHN|nr:META domain-containing protein [Croceibacterium salegens]MXO59098.1 META domain-containing protein [Croceibacterium salegens]